MGLPSYSHGAGLQASAGFTNCIRAGLCRCSPCRVLLRCTWLCFATALLLLLHVLLRRDAWELLHNGWCQTFADLSRHVTQRSVLLHTVDRQVSTLKMESVMALEPDTMNSVMYPVELILTQ